MDGDALISLVVLGPLVTLVFLGRTRAYWVPGLAVLVLGAVVLLTIPEPPPDGEGSAYDALMGAIELYVGIGLVVHGAVCLLIGRVARGAALERARKRLAPEPPPPPELPQAIVVKR